MLETKLTVDCDLQVCKEGRALLKEKFSRTKLIGADCVRDCSNDSAVIEESRGGAMVIVTDSLRKSITAGWAYNKEAYDLLNARGFGEQMVNLQELFGNKENRSVQIFDVRHADESTLSDKWENRKQSFYTVFKDHASGSYNDSTIVEVSLKDERYKSRILIIDHEKSSLYIIPDIQDGQDDYLKVNLF